ncbi:hypothetical protein CK203_086068 [Vitis vinifera]|uniref:Reverse transcriptase domain-containing protein n=1 Tax=Vitis vinifera TaxID=29760 RepID=A0A438D549_VITVI|nr:hypothetical protein CK203_086068 [Vitis vinifera]
MPDRPFLEEEIYNTVLHLNKEKGAFVDGRQILDVVLVANELMDEKKGLREEEVVLKINFEKAYDHVSRVLVHGNAKGWVKAYRGLR